MRSGGMLAAAHVADHQRQARNFVGESGSGFEPDTAVGAGDDGDSTPLIRHVSRRPFPAHLVSTPEERLVHVSSNLEMSRLFCARRGHDSISRWPAAGGYSLRLVEGSF
jgi:hypothetical protein